MATNVDTTAERRFVWVGVAGFLVMLSGAITIIQGLWALDHKGDATSRAAATQLSYTSLETWGWIAIAWGVIVLFAGMAIFARQPWGRWVGIIAAALSLLHAYFWVFAFPIAAFTIIAIDVVVIYGLAMYGGHEEPIG